MQQIISVLAFLFFINIPLTHCSLTLPKPVPNTSPCYYFRPIPFPPHNSPSITPPRRPRERPYREATTPLQPESENTLYALSENNKTESPVDDREIDSPTTENRLAQFTQTVRSFKFEDQ